MRRTPDPTGFLPLTHLVYHLLLALAEAPAHPYALVLSIRERSEGRVDPGTGSFYSIIKRAVDEGLVEETEQTDAADARRRVYAISPLGRRVLEAELHRLEAQVATTRRTLKLSERRGR